MSAAAAEVLDQLLALRKHDLEIRRLERDLAGSPAKLERHRLAMEGIDEKIRAVQDKVRVLKAQAMLRENEAKTFEQKIVRYKSQLSQIKTNKEFVALRSEIANTQGEADRLRSEIRKIQAVVDQAELRVLEFEEAKAREETKAQDARVRIDTELGDVRARRDGLLAERPQLVSPIDRDALELYERARQARGDGMALLEGDYCAACGDLQTKNDVYTVQNRTRLVPCKNCNRILFLA